MSTDAADRRRGAERQRAELSAAIDAAESAPRNSSDASIHVLDFSLAAATRRLHDAKVAANATELQAKTSLEQLEDAQATWNDLQHACTAIHTVVEEALRINDQLREYERGAVEGAAGATSQARSELERKLAADGERAAQHPYTR